MNTSKISVEAGQRFTRLLILGDAPTPDRNRRVFVRCDCGTEKIVQARHLRERSAMSCGCLKRELRYARKGMPSKKPEVVKPGDRFHMLTVVRRADGQTGNNRRYVCLCDCGAETIVSTSHLRPGGTVQSCGCLKLRHGHTVGGKNTRTFNSWDAMTVRCGNPNASNWQSYGGRGITICDRWRGKDGFIHFLADMGERPAGKTIDRIDVNGNYEIGNCRWATPKQQSANKRRV
jgi:hypothetical protein